MVHRDDDERERDEWMGLLQFVLCLALILMIYALSASVWGHC
jgi:hypothetical protein